MATSHPSATARGLTIQEVDDSALPVIQRLNRAIFDEERVINSFNRKGLLMLMAFLQDTPVGFKIGYEKEPSVFYSAKGGVLPEARRQGIARALLEEMLRATRAREYRRFVFDTFPNKHAGMTILALSMGFSLARADYNHTYQDYRLQLSLEL